MINIEDIALGPMDMLIHAIEDHRARFNGMYPHMIELHPAVFADVLGAICEVTGLQIPKGRGVREMQFGGVRVVMNEDAKIPRLHNARWGIEEL